MEEDDENDPTNAIKKIMFANEASEEYTMELKK